MPPPGTLSASMSSLNNLSTLDLVAYTGANCLTGMVIHLVPATLTPKSRP